MQRRDFIKAIAVGTGATAFSGTLVRSTFAAAAEKCLVPWASNTSTVTWKTKPGPYKIALSNSYIGNTWRTEMVQIAKAYAEQPQVKKHLARFQMSSSGNDVNAQIAQINQMILGGFDAIVVDAATPAGLNSVIDQAVNSGVLIISFDNVVTTKKAIAINENQYEMGKKRAEFVVDKTGGKGHYLMVRGLAGTFVDQQQTKAAKEVFSKHSGIKTTEVYGNWDDGTAQKETANALASATKFDGVWSQGGDTGIVRAFQQAGQKVPPIAGLDENGFLKLAAKLKFPMLSIGQSGTLSALSIQVAIAVLQGEKVPQQISVPLPAVTNETLKAGVNYFPDLPDSFLTLVNIDACGLNFDIQDVLKQKV